MLARLTQYLHRHHIGLLALMLALSGTAYAASLPRNSVGTSQLRKNAVTSTKVRNFSLTRKDFKRGQIPAGKQGPQGPQGPRGAQGPPGVNTALVSTDGPGSQQAFCDAGEVAVGGGGAVEGGGFLARSQPLPFDVDVPAIGWEVEGRNPDGTEAFATAWVVCAP